MRTGDAKSASNLILLVPEVLFNVFSRTRKHRLLTWRHNWWQHSCRKAFARFLSPLGPPPKAFPASLCPQPLPGCTAASFGTNGRPALAVPARDYCYSFYHGETLARITPPRLELCFHLALWKSWACRAELWASNAHCNFLSAQVKTPKRSCEQKLRKSS